ncbi:MAG TPA: hypothetical protein VIV60_22895, partial [Polyangiaceae bacterium]
FRPFPSRGIFPTGGVRTVSVNEFRHERFVVDTTEGLHANAAAWGILTVSGGVDYSTRYASFRAYHLSQVAEIDDTTEIAAVPDGAIYYLWRVYYGHSYEEVVSGAADRFTSEVRAMFPVVSGEVSGFARNKNLESRIAGRGMRPTSGKALFAQSPAEIQAMYTMDGPDVPIFVEYRQLSGTMTDRSAVAWLQPLHARVRFTNLTVTNDGSWGTTIWSVSAWCRINARDVPLQHSTVLPDSRVEDGNTYPVTWEEEVSALPGDSLRCGTSARLHDDATPPQSAGDGVMEPTQLQLGLHTSGVFRAGTAKGAYNVGWELDVTP